MPAGFNVDFKVVVFEGNVFQLAIRMAGKGLLHAPGFSVQMRSSGWRTLNRLVNGNLKAEFRKFSNSKRLLK